MPGKVVDASVIAALVFQEPEAGRATSWLEGGDVYAPVLLAYELVSVACKKIRKYPGKRDVLVTGLECALAMDIHWAEPDYPDVLAIALATGLSVYDASYVSLARSLDAELLSFDRDLLAAARKSC